MASNLLQFAGRVALVTGAGGGLGKEYALLLAKRGAAVVVNDLGGDVKGGAGTSDAADKVVEQIKAAGGTAVANYDSVENGESVVKTALDNFGKLDIVINNAGILRDKTFQRISDEDWDLILQIHLRGSFMVTSAAWPHMKAQNFGRIILTSSSSGIYGNFGQANYSAAKLGLTGFGFTLAIEGQKNNILCNTIAPFAQSRMTESLLPDEIKPLLSPSNVAPFVAYLCHDSCEQTGSLFEVGGGWAGQVRWQRTKGGMFLDENNAATPELVRDNFGKITDFEDGGVNTSPSNGIESMTGVLGSIKEHMTSGSKKKKPTQDLSSLIGHKLPSSTFSYTSRDAILYALGVGMSTEHKDSLKFLFEQSDDFSVLPTYGVIPAFGQIEITNEVDINPAKILHGEQYLELMKPLPASAVLRHEGVISDVLDKKSGAVILIDVDSFDEKNELLIRNQYSIFAVGYGGFGGKKASDKMKLSANPPDRPPDASIQEQTGKDQAALYRLSGDYNPLHIDPEFSSQGGFPVPILHGLCSFGFVGRHVLQQYADNDVFRFKAIKVRFSRPVLPGQTIQTDMWKEGNRIYCTAKIAETGEVCISGAYVDLREEGDLAQETQNEPQASDAVFSEISKKVAGDPSLVKQVGGVILYNIKSDGKAAAQWSEIFNGEGAVYQGEPKEGSADTTVTISDEDFVAISAGSLNPQTAFMQGKLTFKGEHFHPSEVCLCPPVMRLTFDP